MNMVLFGPPGAGKGTQSKWLVPHFNLFHIAPGDILREDVRLNTSLGKEVKAYIENGMLVPDQVVIQSVSNAMKKHSDVQGFLFDGYPRTEEQAIALDKQLTDQGRTLDLVLFLQVSQDVSYQRIKKRSEELFRIDDQSDEKIATRFRHYSHATYPVTNYYTQQKKLIHIPGNLSISHVQACIRKHVNNHFARKM